MSCQAPRGWKGKQRLWTYGDSEQGFTIENQDGALLVTTWGFWSVEFVPEFLPAVLAGLENQGKGGVLIVDLKQLRPLRDEGQAAFRTLLTRALSGGASDIQLRGASALTKLQMLRLIRELGTPERIRVT